MGKILGKPHAKTAVSEEAAVAVVELIYGLHIQAGLGRVGPPFVVSPVLIPT